MTGHRMSALPIAAQCARAPGLDTGSGRSAIMSQAWHARCAGAKGFAALLASLTSEEAETVIGWELPYAVELPAGCEPAILEYDQAETELEVALTQSGSVPVLGGMPPMTIGHLDFAWVVRFPDGMRVAYVGDLKKSEFTSSVDSLQLMAYGFAYSALRQCDAFCTGIWAGESGSWLWGDIIDLESDVAFEWWTKVKAAALNTDPEFRRGPHCRGCWSRFQCPAHILPPDAVQGSSLAIASGQGVVTPEKVAQLVLDIARAEDTIKTAKAFAKDWEANHPGQVTLNGKVWRPVKMPGRAGFDKEGLLREYPEAKKFITRGEGYEQMKWINAK